MFNKKRKIRNYIPSYQRRRPLPQSKSYRKQLKRKNPRIAELNRRIRIIIFAIAILFGIYSLFFSKYFKIQEILFSDPAIEGTPISTEIKTNLQTSLNQNLIFIDLEELETKIIKLFPELETIKISKNYPRAIVIEFSKYPLTANIINESSTIKQSFIINSIGYVAKENFENPNLPKIKIISDEPLNKDKALIEKTNLDYITAAISEFESKFGMKIIEANYKPIPRELHLLTEKDTYIWLDIQQPYDLQFKKLKKALIKLDIYNTPIAYIDLRIAANNGDRIIYKLR